MTSPYLLRPLRTIEQATHDIEVARARLRLRLIKTSDGSPLEPVDHFVQRRSFLSARIARERRGIAP